MGYADDVLENFGAGHMLRTQNERRWFAHQRSVSNRLQRAAGEPTREDRRFDEAFDKWADKFDRWIEIKPHPLPF